MTKPASHTSDASDADRRRSARMTVIHGMAIVLLQWADELELHEASAHLTMVMHALQKECPDLLEPSAAVLLGRTIDADG